MSASDQSILLHPSTNTGLLQAQGEGQVPDPSASSAPTSASAADNWPSLPNPSTSMDASHSHPQQLHYSQESMGLGLTFPPTQAGLMFPPSLHQQHQHSLQQAQEQPYLNVSHNLADQPLLLPVHMQQELATSFDPSITPQCHSHSQQPHFGAFANGGIGGRQLARLSMPTGLMQGPASAPAYMSHPLAASQFPTSGPHFAQHQHEHQQAQHEAQALAPTPTPISVPVPARTTSSVMRAIEDPQTYALENGLPPIPTTGHLPPQPLPTQPVQAQASPPQPPPQPQHQAQVQPHAQSHAQPQPQALDPRLPQHPQLAQLTQIGQRTKAQSPLGSSGWTPAKLYQTPIRRMHGTPGCPPPGGGWKASGSATGSGAAGSGRRGSAGSGGKSKSGSPSSAGGRESATPRGSGRSPRDISGLSGEDEECQAEPERKEREGEGAEDEEVEERQRAGRGRKRRTPSGRAEGRPGKKRAPQPAYVRALESNLERLKSQILALGSQPYGLEGVNERAGGMTLDSAKLVIQAQQLDLDAVCGRWEGAKREISQLRAAMNNSHAIPLSSNPTANLRHSLSTSNLTTLNVPQRGFQPPSFRLSPEELDLARRGSVESVTSNASTSSIASANSATSMASVSSATSMLSASSYSSVDSTASTTSPQSGPLPVTPGHSDPSAMPTFPNPLIPHSNLSSTLHTTPPASGTCTPLTAQAVHTVQPQAPQALAPQAMASQVTQGIFHQPPLTASSAAVHQWQQQWQRAHSATGFAARVECSGPI